MICCDANLNRIENQQASVESDTLVFTVAFFFLISSYLCLYLREDRVVLWGVCLAQWHSSCVQSSKIEQKRHSLFYAAIFQPSFNSEGIKGKKKKKWNSLNIDVRA